MTKKSPRPALGRWPVQQANRILAWNQLPQNSSRMRCCSTSDRLVGNLDKTVPVAVPNYKKQYTVGIGRVYEESPLGLRNRCHAFWRAATSKKVVAALETMRLCQMQWQVGLFFTNRIRFAMAPDLLSRNSVGKLRVRRDHHDYHAYDPSAKGTRVATIACATMKGMSLATFTGTRPRVLLPL